MKKMSRIIATAAILAMLVGTAYAAQSGLSITADQLDYNAQTKVATVRGNVVVAQNGNTVTGASGWYNVANKEASLEGGVQLVGPSLQGHANSIHLYDDNHIIASGNAYFQKGDQSISGANVNYDSATGYGEVSGGGTITTAEASLSANHITAWMNRIYAVGTGNVTLRSSVHNLYATGNEIEYTQTPGSNNGIAYLKGNAYAEQNGNTLYGETLIIHLANNSIETQGRSTLTIQPQP